MRESLEIVNRSLIIITNKKIVYKNYAILREHDKVNENNFEVLFFDSMANKYHLSKANFCGVHFPSNIEHEFFAFAERFGSSKILISNIQQSDFLKQIEKGLHVEGKIQPRHPYTDKGNKLHQVVEEILTQFRGEQIYFPTGKLNNLQQDSVHYTGNIYQERIPKILKRLKVSFEKEQINTKYGMQEAYKILDRGVAGKRPRDLFHLEPDENVKLSSSTFRQIGELINRGAKQKHIRTELQTLVKKQKKDINSIMDKDILILRDKLEDLYKDTVGKYNKVYSKFAKEEEKLWLERGKKLDMNNFRQTLKDLGFDDETSDLLYKIAQNKDSLYDNEIRTITSHYNLHEQFIKDNDTEELVKYNLVDKHIRSKNFKSALEVSSYMLNRKHRYDHERLSDELEAALETYVNNPKYYIALLNKVGMTHNQLAKIIKKNQKAFDNLEYLVENKKNHLPFYDETNKAREIMHEGFFDILIQRGFSPEEVKWIQQFMFYPGAQLHYGLEQLKKELKLFKPHLLATAKQDLTIKLAEKLLGKDKITKKAFNNLFDDRDVVSHYHTTDQPEHYRLLFTENNSRELFSNSKKNQKSRKHTYMAI